MPTKNTTTDYTRAMLTINKASEMTYNHRRSIAAWLRKTATFLTSKQVTRQGLAKRFTARYITTTKKGS